MRFADILSSPLKRFLLIFPPPTGKIDSLMPYSLAISELFLTASASATIFSLNARLYEQRRGWKCVFSERDAFLFFALIINTIGLRAFSLVHFSLFENGIL